MNFLEFSSLIDCATRIDYINSLIENKEHSGVVLTEILRLNEQPALARAGYPMPPPLPSHMRVVPPAGGTPGEDFRSPAETGVDLSTGTPAIGPGLARHDPGQLRMLDQLASDSGPLGQARDNLQAVASFLGRAKRAGGGLWADKFKNLMPNLSKVIDFVGKLQGNLQKASVGSSQYQRPAWQAGGSVTPSGEEPGEAMKVAGRSRMKRGRDYRGKRFVSPKETPSEAMARILGR